MRHELHTVVLCGVSEARPGRYYPRDGVNAFHARLPKPLDLSEYDMALGSILFPTNIATLKCPFGYVYCDAVQECPVNNEVHNLLDIFDIAPDRSVYRVKRLIYHACERKITDSVQFVLARPDGEPFLDAYDLDDLPYKYIIVEVSLRRKINY